MRMRRPALDGVRAVAHVFPTSYAAVDAQLPALVAQHRPDALVMFGLAARTKGMRVEMLARNRTTQVFPDVTRTVPKRGTIKLGASALHGRAPFARLVAAARATGASARLSRHAGTYLCNYGYWRALEAAAKPLRTGRGRVRARPQCAQERAATRTFKGTYTQSAVAGGASHRDCCSRRGTDRPLRFQFPGRPHLAHHRSAPIAQRRMGIFHEHRIFADEPRQHPCHHHLGGAASTILAFDRNT